MVKEVVNYQTSDGQTFSNKKEAEKHQELIDGEIAYRIDYGYGLQSYGFVYVKKRASNISNLYNFMVEDWCHKNLGNKIVWDIDLPVQSWNYTKLSTVPNKESFNNFIMAEL